MQSGTHFGKDLMESRGADVTVSDFSAFLGTRRCKNWPHKTFS